jgi:hypothetical protein
VVGKIPDARVGANRSFRARGWLSGWHGSLEPKTKHTNTMNNPLSFLKLSFAAAMLPLAALAQTPMTTSSATFDPGLPPVQGTREFTFGGNGASNKDLNDSFGGLNFSIGQYLNAASLVAIRQSVNYSNPSPGGRAWNGSTRVAYDHHLLPHGSRVRPFVGVNLGGVYGDGVRDTWAGGLEGGAKFYVIPRTFIYAMAEYAWLFRHAKDINDRFDDGQFNWSVGVGLHF